MPKFANAKEIAKKLRLSTWWVYELAKQGKLPAHRITPRGRLYFVEEEIMASVFPSVRLNRVA